jgi:hypothetical protein
MCLKYHRNAGSGACGKVNHSLPRDRSALISALRCENSSGRGGQCSLANGRQFAPLKEAMDIGISRRRIRSPALTGAHRLGLHGFPSGELIAKRDEIERPVATYEVRLDRLEKTLK